MKGSLLGKSLYLFCAIAGIVAGYGIVTWNGTKENIDNTKDNTLLRENEDSVFFVEENEKEKQEELSELSKKEEVSMDSVTSKVNSEVQIPIVLEAISSSVPQTSSQTIVTPHITSIIEQVPAAVPITESKISSTEKMLLSNTMLTVVPAAEQTEKAETSEDNTDIFENGLPSLGKQWVSVRESMSQPMLPSVTPKLQEMPTEEVITYPVQIFGQVPVINRSDAYISYFEFAYDLVAMLEPMVEERGVNMNSLLTQFAIKALFCGVDIEKLDINAPIPRRLAALCLWLTAQVLNQNGCETSAKSAEGYVKDIAGCTASEKKAIAYLYESGILTGYQVPGQCFYPQEGLKTEVGTDWLSAVKRQWK